MVSGLPGRELFQLVRSASATVCACTYAWGASISVTSLAKYWSVRLRCIYTDLCKGKGPERWLVSLVEGAATMLLVGRSYIGANV